MVQEQQSAFSLTPVGTEIQVYHIENEIESIEEEEEVLTPRERLRKRANELRMRRVKAESKLMGFDFEARQAALQELEWIKLEEEMVESEAAAMGIPSVLML
jgi:hypothetical protein